MGLFLREKKINENSFFFITDFTKMFSGAINKAYN